MTAIRIRTYALPITSSFKDSKLVEPEKELETLIDQLSHENLPRALALYDSDWLTIKQ